MADAPDNSVTVKMPSAPEQAPVSTSDIPNQIPTPQAAAAPDQTASSSADTNAPKTDTPAGASIPKALVNNPQVESQKAATQVDLNKKSPAPWHSWIRHAAVALAGGPQIRTDIDQNGKITRTEVQPSLAHVGMALAAEIIKGGIAGGNAKDSVGAAQAGVGVAEQRAAQVKQANADQENQAKSDQAYKMNIFRANMQNYQTSVNAGKTSQAVSQAASDSQKDLAEGLENKTFDLPEGMSVGPRQSGKSVAAAIQNKTINPTTDLVLPIGDSKPVLGADGKQEVVNGVPHFESDYIVVKGAGSDAKIKLTPKMQKDFTSAGIMSELPEGGIGAPDWSIADIARKYAQLSSIKAGETILQQHKDDAHEYLGKDPTKLDDLAKAVKTDPAMRQAVQLFAQAQQGAKSSIPGLAPSIADIFSALDSSNIPGAQAASGTLKNYLGLTPKDLDDINLKRVEGEAEAKDTKTNPVETDKEKRLAVLTSDPITAASVDSIIAAHDKPAGGIKIPDDRYKQAVAFNNEVVKQSGLKAGSEALAKAKADANEPEMLSLAKNIIGGDIAKLSDVTTYRKDQRAALAIALHNEAIAEGKDPNDWSATALETKAAMYKDYKEGKTSNQVQAFDAFLGHSGDAMDANDEWRRTGSKLINQPLNWLAKNAANDQNYEAFTDSLEPVRKEFMSFLNANRAEHVEDIRVMQTVLDDTKSPAQIETALKQLGRSADIRLRSLGTKWRNTMHSEYPNLVSDDGMRTLQRMNVRSSDGRAMSGRTVNMGGQKIPVNADGTVTVKGHDYTIGADNKTLTLKK